MKVNSRYETIKARIGIISIYLAGIILLLMAADSCASEHLITALMLGLPGVFYLLVGLYIGRMLRTMGRHSPSAGLSEGSTELQVASLFLLHLGFPEATEQNVERTADLLQLLADACDIINPDSESAEQDARQLAAQLGGMAERIAEGKAD